MKIYTKSGDNGTTSLIGGKRVPKNHIRLEAYGTIDELISQMGVVRACDIPEDYKKKIILIQKKLMDCSALLAAEADITKKLPEITGYDVEFLEKEIDLIDKNLPPLKTFIVPGNTLEGSFCHVARSVCRRAERIITTLAFEENINTHILKFINRLSDFLYVLARSIDNDTDYENIW